MISLRDITKENYEAICDLEVTESQEDYVAGNTWSIVESVFNDNYTARAIYQQNTPVGMLMWVKESNKKVSIWRFMVDQQFQQGGVGRKAMSLALEEIKQDIDLDEIEICYVPSNPVAKNFYGSFGFVEVGMDDDNEEMLAILKLTN